MLPEDKSMHRQAEEGGMLVNMPTDDNAARRGVDPADPGWTSGDAHYAPASVVETCRPARLRRRQSHTSRPAPPTGISNPKVNAR